MQIDERAQLNEVKNGENPEPTHQGLHQRRHCEPLRCPVVKRTMLPICAVYFIKCMTQDRLSIAFIREIEGFFLVQRLHDCFEELK